MSENRIAKFFLGRKVDPAPSLLFDKLMDEAKKRRESLEEKKRQEKELKEKSNKSHKNDEIKELKEKISSSKTRLSQYEKYHNDVQVLQKTYKLELDKQGVEKLYRKVIKKLVNEKFQDYLESLLTVSHNETVPLTCDQLDTKEKYKIYGLVIFGCSDVIKDSDCSQNEEDSARSLTCSMLTLLPPLIVCQPVKYSPCLQDTNRANWNEDDNECKLHYYRPVLVYSNRLHVAVKGLVGNVKKSTEGGTKRFIESVGAKSAHDQTLTSTDTSKAGIPPAAKTEEDGGKNEDKSQISEDWLDIEEASRSNTV